MFTKRIKQLSEALQIQQQRLAATLETDIATCCKNRKRRVQIGKQSLDYCTTEY
jgi:hypothetical protein